LDLSIVKETELQEELNELQKRNNMMEEELSTLMKKVHEYEQDKRQADGHRDMLMRQVKKMEVKEDKRETYIKGIEKQLRQAQDENQRIQKDTNQND
jgi:predicted  nucleic acid-binding Zn-ribbon protein